MLNTLTLEKVLAEVHSPRSRRDNVLTAKEIKDIIEQIKNHEHEIFIPEDEISWFGMDYENEMVHKGESKEEVLEAWQESASIDGPLTEITLGENAIVYQQVTGIGTRQELYLLRSDQLPVWGLVIDSDGNVVKVD